MTVWILWTCPRMSSYLSSGHLWEWRLPVDHTHLSQLQDGVLPLNLLIYALNFKVDLDHVSELLECYSLILASQFMTLFSLGHVQVDVGTSEIMILQSDLLPKPTLLQKVDLHSWKTGRWVFKTVHPLKVMLCQRNCCTSSLSRAMNVYCCEVNTLHVEWALTGAHFGYR